MENNKQYSISEHIRYEIEGGAGERELIIPNKDGVPDMKSVLCLSDTSLHIWNLIREKKNCSQIIDEISQRYNREREEIASDVKEFIGTLLDKGYISIAE